MEDKDNFIVLFGYASALGPEYCSKSIKWMLSKALTEQRGEPTPAPEIEATLNCPPHSEYKPSKKGGPKPKYPAKFKRGLHIWYDTEAEGMIMGAHNLMKKFLRQKIGPHAFMREIPGEDAGKKSVKKFREDCNVHMAA